MTSTESTGRRKVDVTFRQTKVAWIRNRDVPAGQPALGHFDCPCGSKVTDVEFGGPDVTCGACGQAFDGRGWLISLPAGLKATRQGEGLLGW